MESQTGLVGFFDILGYQNLLEKNDATDIAKTIIPYLLGLPGEVSKSLNSLLRYLDTKPAVARKAVDSIRWVIFSDTILLTMPFFEDDEITPTLRWISFIFECSALQTKMFRGGLPIRGAIDYGKFYVKETCFAGEAIVNAYRLCNKLELAAAVLTETARSHLDKDLKPERESSQPTVSGLHFFYEYLVPTKDGEVYMTALASHAYNDEDEDISRQVLAAFWGHNKDVPLVTQPKIANTAQWLRFLEMKSADKKKMEKDKKEEK